MAKFDWASVKKEDVIKAIELFLQENPEYPAPRSTFLIYDGKKLPAKHIRGMAYKVAHNQEISKEDYAGGMETVRFFERLGFETFHADKAEQTKSIPKEKAHAEVEKESAKKVDIKITVQEKPVALCGEQKTSTETAEREKIKIPSKGVIEQKNALQLILNKMFDGDIVCEKTYSWLKTPEKLDEEYQRLFKALSNYRGNTDFAKKNVVLRCDFVCEGQKLIIEYDERQHFSEARRVSLESYENVLLNYDRELWIRACQDIQAKDGQPANRDEVRAYYDSTRDIEAAKHGYKLVRIMHGQIDFEADNAALKLQELLENAEVENALDLKVAMYLQSEQWKNQKEFDKAMEIERKSDADILVFPEFCWTPFVNYIYGADVMAEDIYSAEQFLPKLYSDKLKHFNNRRYILVNKYPELVREDYRNLLSIVLKVRAMENFCAVILESNIANNCYQTGKSKTAQVVKVVDGQYGLDLSRMTGPEAIWKNKGTDFKASWRTNFEWLANQCKQIRDTGEWGE